MTDIRDKAQLAGIKAFYDYLDPLPDSESLPTSWPYSPAHISNALLECVNAALKAAQPEDDPYREALLKCVVPLEALHADNLAGSQLIAPSLRERIADAVWAMRGVIGAEIRQVLGDKHE